MEQEALAFGALSAVIKYLIHYHGAEKRPTAAKRVGTVKSISLYPVKSMSAVELQECECTYAGLEHVGVRDRQWMIVTAQNHKFISARAQPKLVTIATSIHGNDVHLDASGMTTLVLEKNVNSNKATITKTEVWGQQITGVDVGDAAAAWVEKVLDKPAGTYRLLQHSLDLRKRVLTKQEDEWCKQCKPQDEVQYQDGFPYLLISGASLVSLTQSVEERTGKTMPMSMKRFRPNIEVEGCDAYAEDQWKEVYIGEHVKFSNMKPCGRCVMTTVDADLGKKNQDSEPLNTLKQIRPHVDGSPAFGVNLVVDWPGIISVGQPVYAIC